MYHQPALLAAIMLALTLALAAFTEPFGVSAEREDIRAITKSEERYAIVVAGTADMDNTATRHHSTWSIGFQNNVELTIANTGSVPVVNPRIVTNDARKWHTAESMIAEFTEGARDPQEKIYLIWEGLRQNRHHDAPLFEGQDYHDPVRFLCVYGGGLCDDASASGAALYHTAGFNEEAGGQNPFQRGLHGHVMCEVWHDGDYQFMDIDQDTFFLDRENRKPVSGDTLVRDHDLARRELAYGPLFNGWEAPINNASLFGADDIRAEYWSIGHRMEYTLRPGERIAFFWERTGKTPWKEVAREHRFYGNSLLTYDLPTGPEDFGTTDVELSNVAPHTGGLFILDDEASITIPTKTPYTICGATLQVDLPSALPADSTLAVALSFDGENFSDVKTIEPAGATEHTIALDKALGVHGNDARRSLWARIRFSGANATFIKGIQLQTDLYAYPIALPRLSLGENTVAYQDETTGPHEVTVTYRWRESDSETPPAPPAAPTTPADGAALSATYIPIAWPAVEGCDAYGLRVSRDPDFRYPYRPNYDVILPENRHEVPFRGMFSPGETYYWRVRPRLANGLWGDWSETWTFTWTGPTVPKPVALESDGNGGLVFRWQPNASGTAPVRYRVYGSNERGFSIGNDLIQAMRRGPALVSVETDSTELLVVGPHATGPLANLAYYRVVAIDDAGVESCPSDYVEVKRPYVYSAPATAAQVGEAYHYDVETVESIGDWQHRYDKPNKAFWEKEAYRFHLVEGPEWLQLDEATGVLAGTPPPGAEGTAPVVVVLIETTFPHEIPEDGTQAAAFRKATLARAASAEHRFTIAVAAAEATAP